MFTRAFLAAAILALLGCPGGSGSIGDTCDSTSDCDSALQCVADVCVPLCQRAPECGDGYACDSNGYCIAARGNTGDPCHSEVECSAGLACQLDGFTTDDEGLLTASCTKENPGKPSTALCATDSDCRNGTCALGRCVDLCDASRDCSAGTSCMSVPRVESPANGAMFEACLPSRGNLRWEIPIAGPAMDFLFPVPSDARSATVVFSVEDAAQKVGASRVIAPHDDPSDASYVRPCIPTGPGDLLCNAVSALDEYFRQRMRHAPEFGQSVLQIPSSPASALQAGAYKISVSSLRANGAPGSAIPKVTAILKMDTAQNLDLHFHFLDLDEHPCAAALGNEHFDAVVAKDASFFQTNFLGELRTIFASAGIAVGDVTYTDLRDRPDLDGLSVENAAALFSLGTHDKGVDIFFVRSLSPVGLQAFGPNPGPGGLAGTRQSGIAIGMDTLCYRSWPTLARLTAHEVARYMGLFHNIEVEAAEHPAWRDAIGDSDDSVDNLMFFSELGGDELSAGQREILSRSTVLR